MVILHLLHRSIRICSSVIRTNYGSPHKRLLLDRAEPWLLSKKNHFNSYEGDGKTVGFVINKRDADVLLISEILKYGFILASGAELVGSLIIFPHSIISWNVLNAKEVSEDSLTLFKILDPKIDILVFGYGSPKDYTPEIGQNFSKICKKLGLRYEALPTEHAVGVYNFLADERRLVAAALIPPSDVRILRFDHNVDTETDLLTDGEDQQAIDDMMRDRKLIN